MRRERERDGNKSSEFPFLWRNESHGWDCHHRGSRTGHTCSLQLAPFLGGFFVRSFVFFFIFLRKRGYCNGEMNEAPSRSGKEENNSAWVSVYGKFWISWRPWVYGYRRRLSPNERDIVFETKPLISSIRKGKRVSLIVEGNFFLISFSRSAKGYIQQFHAGKRVSYTFCSFLS
jgi:hypothetical protein